MSEKNLAMPNQIELGKTRRIPRRSQNLDGAAAADFIEGQCMPIPECGCLIWMGSLLPKRGYGNIKFKSRQTYVHRVMYELRCGPIPEGLEIDHKCRVRSCCNPAHLEAVTPQINTLRGFSMAARHAARTHCKNGHLLAGDNLSAWRQSPGMRTCKICNTERARRYRQEGRRK